MAEEDRKGVFGGEEEGGGVRRGPGEARTILLRHFISARTSKQPRMVRTFPVDAPRGRTAKPRPLPLPSRPSADAGLAKKRFDGEAFDKDAVLSPCTRFPAFSVILPLI